MKILLLNDNPVVNKLVTLSAQKTSDDLDVFDDIEAVDNGSYDLLVVDDTLYTSDVVANLKEKISFQKSLYICSRDAQPADEFTKTIKKPFLPTDLVELFSSMGKEISEIDVNESPDFGEIEEMSLAPDKEVLLDSLEDELDLELDDTSLDKELTLDDDLDLGDLDEEISLDDDLDLGDLEDEISLDEELDEEINLEDDSEGVLDKDDLKEVQDLLDDADADLDLEDELEIDLEEPEVPSEKLEEDLDLDDLDLGDDLDLEEELELDLEEEASTEAVEESEEDLDLDDLDLGDDLDLEEELELDLEEELEADFEEVEMPAEDELELDDLDLGDELDLEEPEVPVEEVEELEEELDSASDLNIEDQILNAVSELSEEDLESEVSEEALLEIATNEIDSIDELNERDLKIAIGEEVEDLAPEPIEEVSDEESKDLVTDSQDDTEIESENEGLESLKKLLKVLSDKDVAASMKGMKISINIELGENK